MLFGYIVVQQMERIRTYSELKTIPDFLGRFNYLKLNGIVGEMNLEVNRYLNQYFYHTPEWKNTRRQILIRDNGFDLGIEGRTIFGKPLVHHINPISVKDVVERDPGLFDLDNLILVSHETHNAIHYGNEELLIPDAFAERKPGDTLLW